MMILEQLKLKTRQQHARLHQHPLLKGITQSEYSLARYIQLLKAYYEIYSAIETVLLQRQSQFKLDFDYHARYKLPWLYADLTDLKSSPGMIHPTLAKETAGFITTPEQWLGAAYVLEGSTLGASVISTCLQKSLRISPQYAGRFFNAYGLNTSKYWHEYQIFLANQPMVATTKITDAASQTFDLFNQGLDLYAQ
ncbi:biliverdin-producing heme oxygenase [uncultured Deefgea sp.]|uniref:biliverdin-producing heme oxygenase n=1 Tax=uncultured Deefgea sp. TaxID=1304914 RepID=UPI0025924C3F|nr:biliverdin-producing heme oxygenase [uncultured Deefgea sp.]